MLKGKWFQRKDVEVWFWIDDKFVISLKELDCLFPSWFYISMNWWHKLWSFRVIFDILQIKNSRGDVLQCSHYMPIVSPDGKPLPCVIYCHGNRWLYGYISLLYNKRLFVDAWYKVVLTLCNDYGSGCRVDASETAMVLLPSNITVFALDFSGSGVSGGEHVTLGWNEVSVCSVTVWKNTVNIVKYDLTAIYFQKDDLRAVVNYLRTDESVSLIGLWGRSMGAVTRLVFVIHFFIWPYNLNEIKLKCIHNTALCSHWW